eukprot:m.57491 g.57491  ORF g.57491 m.57491 type:complete len:461 (+) comp11112_c0_seq2:226-1608(+)
MDYLDGEKQKLPPDAACRHGDRSPCFLHLRRAAKKTSEEALKRDFLSGTLNKEFYHKPCAIPSQEKEEHTRFRNRFNQAKSRLPKTSAVDVENLMEHVFATLQRDREQLYEGSRRHLDHLVSSRTQGDFWNEYKRLQRLARRFCTDLESLQSDIRSAKESDEAETSPALDNVDERSTPSPIWPVENVIEDIGGDINNLPGLELQLPTQDPRSAYDHGSIPLVAYSGAGDNTTPDNDPPGQLMEFDNIDNLNGDLLMDVETEDRFQPPSNPIFFNGSFSLFDGSVIVEQSVIGADACSTSFLNNRVKTVNPSKCNQLLKKLTGYDMKVDPKKFKVLQNGKFQTWSIYITHIGNEKAEVNKHKGMIKQEHVHRIIKALMIFIERSDQKQIKYDRDICAHPDVSVCPDESVHKMKVPKTKEEAVHDMIYKKLMETTRKRASIAEVFECPQDAYIPGQQSLAYL